MSQYVCTNCCLMMVQQISNVSWFYKCKNCQETKQPQSAIIFSSDDHQNESTRVIDVEQIIDDSTVQKIDNICPKCSQNYRVFYQFGNKDTRMICECDRPAYDDIPDDYATGLADRNSRQKLYINQTNHYYISKLHKTHPF